MVSKLQLDGTVSNTFHKNETDFRLTMQELSMNPTFYNIIRWFACLLGQMTHRPSQTDVDYRHLSNPCREPQWGKSVLK